uniref:Serine/threonine protein kinase n=1 Tax=Strongyloides venezuelensis TaxID=75913 RepID=A0A0K0F3W9_STRVS
MEYTEIKKEDIDKKEISCKSKLPIPKKSKNCLETFEKMSVEEMVEPGKINKVLQNMELFNTTDNVTAILHYLVNIQQIELSVISSSYKDIFPLLKKVRQNKVFSNNSDIIKLVAALMSRLYKYMVEQGKVDKVTMSEIYKNFMEDCNSSRKRRHKPAVSLGKHRLTGLYGENDNLPPSPTKPKKVKNPNSCRNEGSYHSAGNIGLSEDYSKYAGKKTLILSSHTQCQRLFDRVHYCIKQNAELSYVIPVINKEYVEKIPLSYSYINPQLYEIFIQDKVLTVSEEEQTIKEEEYKELMDYLNKDRLDKTKINLCKTFPQNLDDQTVCEYQRVENKTIVHKLIIQKKTVVESKLSTFFEINSDEAPPSVRVQNILDKLRKE